MIRPERLTIKGQEAFRDAGEIARRRGNPVVNDAHLLAALLAQPEGVVQPLLQKVGLNVTALMQEVERELNRFPKQEGGTAEPSFSRELQRVRGLHASRGTQLGGGTQLITRKVNEQDPSAAREQLFIALRQRLVARPVGDHHDLEERQGGGHQFPPTLVGVFE